MSYRLVTGDDTHTLDADQRILPPAVQEIVGEVKLLRENIKMCENTIQLCNARLSTITAVCQLYVHQSPTAPPFLQGGVPIVSGKYGGETAQPEDNR